MGCTRLVRLKNCKLDKFERMYTRNKIWWDELDYITRYRISLKGKTTVLSIKYI